MHEREPISTYSRLAHQGVAPSSQDGDNDPPFRFFDNREKYLLFVSTCNEKQIIADRVAMDIRYMRPVQPALRVFDAGIGDATVLSRMIRYLHRTFPTVPFLIVGKEISEQDVLVSLEKIPDRLQEHPQTVMVVTNMLYPEATRLYPRSEVAQAALNWLEVPLEGNSAYEFDAQIRDLTPHVQNSWRTKPSNRTGNPAYVIPSVLVIYRRDQMWPLAPVIPQKGDLDREYDLVIAAQPYRARASVALKVKNVLAPLTRSLAPGGCMVVIQSTGKDPGMEIIRTIWPGEDPFQTPRQHLLRELRASLSESLPALRYLSYPDSRAEFRFNLQRSPSEIADRIGTSALLAAWNAATYVAQIEDERLWEAMDQRDYLDATGHVLQKYDGLWFIDESFVVARPHK